MTAHNWKREGVNPESPGPQWASTYTMDQIRSAADFALEFQRRGNGMLGAFWPLEWRLVVEWAMLFEEIKDIHPEPPAYRIEQHWERVTE